MEPHVSEADDIVPISWTPSHSDMSLFSELSDKIPSLMKEMMRGQELRASKGRYHRKQTELRLRKASSNQCYRKTPHFTPRKPPCHPKKTSNPKTNSCLVKNNNNTGQKNSIKIPGLQFPENNDIISIPIVHNKVNRTQPSHSRARNKCKHKRCPVRIMELAEPSKRLCLNTWRNNKDILPPFMVERLKKIVLDQKVVASLPDAITCFKLKKKQRTKHKGYFRTKKDVEFVKKMAEIFSKNVGHRLERPFGVQLTPEHQKLSIVVAESIKKIMSRRKKKSINRTNEKILKDVADKVTIWMSIILDEAGSLLSEEENKEIEERIGPVIDILNDLLDEILKQCIPSIPESEESETGEYEEQKDDEPAEQDGHTNLPINEQSSATHLTGESDDELADETHPTGEATDGNDDPENQGADLIIIIETEQIVDDEDVSNSLDASNTEDINQKKVKFSTIGDSNGKLTTNEAHRSSSNLADIDFNPPNEDLLSDADEGWPSFMPYPFMKSSASASKSIESLGKITENGLENMQYPEKNSDNSEFEMKKTKDRSKVPNDSEKKSKDAMTESIDSVELRDFHTEYENIDSIDITTQTLNEIKDSGTGPSFEPKKDSGTGPSFEPKKDSGTGPSFEPKKDSGTGPSFELKKDFGTGPLSEENRDVGLDPSSEETRDIGLDPSSEKKRDVGIDPSFNDNIKREDEVKSTTAYDENTLNGLMEDEKYRIKQSGIPSKDKHNKSDFRHLNDTVDNLENVYDNKKIFNKEDFREKLLDELIYIDGHTPSKRYSSGKDSDGLNYIIEYNKDGSIKKRYPKKKIPKYDYKVYLDSAPSWVRIGDGDSSEDFNKLDKQNIKKWCKDLTTTLTLLEKWNQWIETATNNYLILKKSNEMNKCAKKKCPKKIRDWLHLKGNIEKDSELWKNLYNKAIKKLIKHNRPRNLKNKFVCKCGLS